MADDLKQTGSRDDQRIDVNLDYELTYGRISSASPAIGAPMRSPYKNSSLVRVGTRSCSRRPYFCFSIRPASSKRSYPS